MTKQRRYLLILLLVGLLLRLIYAFTQDPLAPYLPRGGDEAWYLANGFGLFTGHELGWARGVAFYVSRIPTAPLYLIFTGFWQTLLPDAAAVMAIRIVQSLLGIGTAYFAYRITHRITHEERAGVLAAGVIALNPAFIIEPGFIATESLYIFFMTAAIWLSIEWVALREELHPESRLHPLFWVVIAGIAFGLATLTRAVSLLFPVGIAVYMLMIGGRAARRKWATQALLMLVVYAALVASWTLYNLRFDRLVIASDQFVPALWRGAVTGDTSPESVDAQFIEDPTPGECVVDCKQRVEDSALLEDAAATITGDPVRFVRLRLSRLAYSYTQPHGIVPLGRESLRDLVVHWLRDDFSLEGFLRLVNGEGFWPKLVIYVLHYAGIVLGIVGMWITRKSWRASLPPMGFILYTTLIHLVLIVEPRYIFPTTVFFWIFAAAALIRLWDARQRLALRNRSSH